MQLMCKRFTHLPLLGVKIDVFVEVDSYIGLALGGRNQIGSSLLLGDRYIARWERTWLLGLDSFYLPKWILQINHVLAVRDLPRAGHWVQASNPQPNFWKILPTMYCILSIWFELPKFDCLIDLIDCHIFRYDHTNKCRTKSNGFSNFTLINLSTC